MFSACGADISGASNGLTVENVHVRTSLDHVRNTGDMNFSVLTRWKPVSEFPHSISSFLESVECVEIRRAASEYECRVFVFRLMIE